MLFLSIPRVTLETDNLNLRPLISYLLPTVEVLVAHRNTALLLLQDCCRILVRAAPYIIYEALYIAGPGDLSRASIQDPHTPVMIITGAHVRDITGLSRLLVSP